MYQYGKCFCDGCGSEILEGQEKTLLTLGTEIIAIFGSPDCANESKRVILESLMIRSIAIADELYGEGDRFCVFCCQVIDDESDHERCGPHADPQPTSDWN